MSQALASKSLSQAKEIVADYGLSIKSSAAQELRSISDMATLTRLIEKVNSLATEPRPSGSEKLAGGTYQESCPLGVLELRTSMQLTTICALGGPGSWNVRHLIVV